MKGSLPAGESFLYCRLGPLTVFTLRGMSEVAGGANVDVGGVMLTSLVVIYLPC